MINAYQCSSIDIKESMKKYCNPSLPQQKVTELEKCENTIPDEV